MSEPELVAEGVYRIAPGRSNCYLLVDTKLALIDTGMPRDGEAIIAAHKKSRAHCGGYIPYLDNARPS